MRVYASVGRISKKDAARDASVSADAFAVMPKRVAAAVAAEFDAATARGDLVAANYAITQAGAEWAKRIDERRALDFVDDANGTCGKAGVSHGDIVELAKAGARAVSGLTAGVAVDQAAAMADMLAASVGAVFCQGTKDAGKLARGVDSRYWRRQLSAVHGRALEEANRAAGRVHKNASLYVSEETLENRRAQKKRNAGMLSELIAVNQSGQEYTLQELADLGVSNPANRKAELMTRIGGTEEIAQELGHAGEFWTLTAPGVYHATLKNGRKNKKYNGATVRQTQQYMVRLWAQMRAAFQRAGLEMYGFRVVEPHHDGTPHWHMLFFMPSEQVEAARAIMRRYAYRDEAQELKNAKARKARFFAKAIDFEVGSAAGYIAKYISKNIEGGAVGTDHESITAGKRADASRTAEAVEAWAAVNGVRQFQAIGGAPVTAWREMRRLDCNELDGWIEAAARAADDGNWAEFARITAQHSCRVAYETNEGGRYGEMIDKPVGIECDGQIIVTRVNEWKIYQAAEWKKEKAEREFNGRFGSADVLAMRFSGLGFGLGFGLEVGVRQGGAALARTGVNNCTQQKNETGFESVFDEIDAFLKGLANGESGKTGGTGRAGQQQESAAGWRSD